VDRRSEKNVVDLLTELNENNKVMVKTQTVQTEELKGQRKALEGIATLLAASANDTKISQAKQSKAQALQSGAGTKTETGGVAFNPFTASVSALGGDKLRVTFPKAAELIADDRVQMYQCKFTYLKNGKLDANKFRLSKAASADTERTFACTVPAWGEGGKMPDEAEFTTNLQGGCKGAGARMHAARPAAGGTDAVHVGWRVRRGQRSRLGGVAPTSACTAP